MTNQQHSITPPPELCGRWYDESPYDDELGLVEHVATQAARWGADQELEACCEFVFQKFPWDSDLLRQERRRFKPPSLNEIALQMLSTIERDARYLPEITDTIRRALEQLDD